MLTITWTSIFGNAKHGQSHVTVTVMADSEPELVAFCLPSTMASSLSALVLALLSAILLFFGYAAFNIFVAPYLNPLHQIDGPPVRGLFGNHISLLLECGFRPRCDPNAAARAHHILPHRQAVSIIQDTRHTCVADREKNPDLRGW